MEELKEGDIILYKIAMHMGITRTILHDGKLCMESNFMYGDKMPIDIFLSDPFSSVTRLSLTDLYRLCKKNNWNTKEYMIKFGSKQRNNEKNRIQTRI